jgi:hypothetical protein
VPIRYEEAKASAGGVFTCIRIKQDISRSCLPCTTGLGWLVCRLTEERWYSDGLNQPSGVITRVSKDSAPKKEVDEGIGL